MGFEVLITDSCLFINWQDGILVITYINDFLAVGPKSEVLDTFWYELYSKWTIKKLGDIEYFLDIRIVYNKENNKLYLYQDTYINKILIRYSITNSKLIETSMVSGVLELIVPFDSIVLKKDIKEYNFISHSNKIKFKRATKDLFNTIKGQV